MSDNETRESGLFRAWFIFTFVTQVRRTKFRKIFIENFFSKRRVLTDRIFFSLKVRVSVRIAWIPASPKSDAIFSHSIFAWTRKMAIRGAVNALKRRAWRTLSYKKLQCSQLCFSFFRVVFVMEAVHGGLVIIRKNVHTVRVRMQYKWYYCAVWSGVTRERGYTKRRDNPGVRSPSAAPV